MDQTSGKLKFELYFIRGIHIVVFLVFFWCFLGGFFSGFLVVFNRVSSRLEFSFC